MKKFDNLQDLTRQESGVVIYDNKQAIICNWSSIHGLPRIFAESVMGLGDEIEIDGATEVVKDCRGLLQDVTVIYDQNDDMGNAFNQPVEAKIYRTTDGVTIIAPETWN